MNTLNSFDFPHSIHFDALIAEIDAVDTAELATHTRKKDHIVDTAPHKLVTRVMPFMMKMAFHDYSVDDSTILLQSRF